jgi:glyoxylase-like metal-dependent hydrolase (beta-lactamase superfamily II)
MPRKKIVVRLFPVAAVAAAALCAVATPRAQQVPLVRALTEPWREVVRVQGIELVPVRKNVYMLVGGGGNVTVVFGDEGVVLVDSGASGRSAALLAAVKQATPKPLRYLINTSDDPDHIGGNGDVVKAAGGIAGPGVGGGGGGGGNAQQNVGLRTIAHENAVNRMIAGTKELAALTGDAVPDSTFFTPRKDIFANGEGIELLSQPAAHSDGDVFVYFRGSDVVSAGDVYRTDSYPRIDLARGGSIAGELDALTTLLDITIPERNQMGGTLVVPGHGRVSNEADVLEYRDMLTIIRDRVQALIKKGMTLEQVKAAKPALEYDPIYGTQKDWTGDMFLEVVYRDLSQKK